MLEQAIDVEPARSGRDGRAALMLAMRFVLPAVIIVAGLIIMALGSDVDLEGGAGIVSAGGAIYLMNWLYRASIDGDRERDIEEAAREYFDRHGYWPGEAPSTEPRTAGAGES
jgi:hypothetical protein